MEKHRPVAITNIKRRKQAAENTLWKQYGPKLCLLAIICAITAQLQDVYGLECYFGLGNTSVRNKQKTTQCPGDYMVCKKMYGGGMGDQIRRYCDEMESDAYHRLKEIEKNKLNDTIEDTEDSECYDATDHGRKVIICECTTDLCNGASTFNRFNNNNVITNIRNYLLILFSILHLNHNLEQGYI